jgi:hypothetical protein
LHVSLASEKHILPLSIWISLPWQETLGVRTPSLELGPGPEEAAKKVANDCALGLASKQASQMSNYVKLSIQQVQHDPSLEHLGTLISHLHSGNQTWRNIPDDFPIETFGDFPWPWPPESCWLRHQLATEMLLLACSSAVSLPSTARLIH